jgi:predicted peptidase
VLFLSLLTRTLRIIQEYRIMMRSLLSLAFLARAGAADVTTGFLDKIHKDADGSEHKYVVFVPHDYKGDKEYPVILFLHGSGETKGDKGGKMPVEVGIGTAIKKREKTFPFIVVIPQSEKRTWQADSAEAQRALAMLDETCKTYKIRELIEALKKAGSKVIYTEYPKVGHNSWDKAYATDDLYTWLLEQKKQ